MFNVLLKDLRAKKGITQVQLAKAAGVSPGNVGDWETGKSKPGYNALAALSRIFEVSADYLLELGELHEETSDDRLAGYKEEQGLTCDGSPLAPEEADLVAMYRLLPIYAQEDLFDQIHCLYQKYAERQRLLSTGRMPPTGKKKRHPKEMKRRAGLPDFLVPF